MLSAVLSLLSLDQICQKSSEGLLETPGWNFAATCIQHLKANQGNMFLALSSV
jgi:hypothetical protein